MLGWLGFGGGFRPVFSHIYTQPAAKTHKFDSLGGIFPDLEMRRKLSKENGKGV